MKSKVSPATVGLFVLGALVLGVISLISFGGMTFFSQPQRFVVFFDETIHGLEVGSPVKLRGVRVGRVAAISLRYSSDANASVVAVTCELSRDVIEDASGVAMDVTAREELAHMVERGLRARLGVIGLATGLLYVELDFLDPAEFPLPEDTPYPDAEYVHVPAVPSAISQFQASLTDILNDMTQINFAALGEELHGLLADTRRQVNSLDLQPLVAQWTATGKSIDGFINGPQLTSTLENLDGAVAGLRSVMDKLDQRIDPLGSDLEATLATARESLDAFSSAALTLRNFVDAQQHLGAGAGQAFTRIAEAAAAVERLADFLERNPGALLSGRRPPADPASR